MKNYASKFPLPTGATWARLPERVAALENPKVLKAVVSQLNTSAPTFVSSQKNSTGATITFGYTSTGTFTINSTLPIFTVGKTGVTIGGGANPFTYTAVVSPSQIVVQIYNSAGSLANSILSGNMLSIEILN